MIEPLIQDTPSAAAICSVMPELRESDLKEERKIAHNGCKCTKGPGNTPCCQQFREDHYREMRGQCTELSREEKDLVIKAQLIASTNCDETTKHESVYRHNHSQSREREYTTYRHCGLPVCSETFLFLHGLGSWAFKNIRRSCKEDGLTPRVKHQLPPNDSPSIRQLEWLHFFGTTLSHFQLLFLI